VTTPGKGFINDAQADVDAPCRGGFSSEARTITEKTIERNLFGNDHSLSNAGVSHFLCLRKTDRIKNRSISKFWPIVDCIAGVERKGTQS